MANIRDLAMGDIEKNGICGAWTQSIVDFVSTHSDNQSYYDNVDPTVFVWGLGKREADLTLQIICSIVPKLENVDDRISPILTAAVESTEEEVLKEQLEVAQKLRLGREQRHLVRAAICLLEWKLVQKEPWVAATEMAFCFVKHNQNYGDLKAAVTIMDFIRAEISFERWEQSLEVPYSNDWPGAKAEE
jgi:hypothetical protein